MIFFQTALNSRAVSLDTAYGLLLCSRGVETRKGQSAA